jgi:HAD superfamily hydrolase (TIGR01484 family)
MESIDRFPAQQTGTIKYLLTDIDDTLTNHGRIPGSAYQALENLQKKDIKVIPITGRPAGWCDLIARMWPVAGVVGENGAFYFVYDEKNKKMIRRYTKTAKERANDRVKLSEICDDILRSVPGCALSADQHYREADLAIDFCEDVPPLSGKSIQKIVEIFERHGAGAKISSIHVNGWFGNYDKLSMTKILFAEQYGVQLDEIREQVVYAGDSPNDEPMFAYFPHSVGVANVLQFADILSHKPRWITEDEGGYGFSQLANHLLRATSPSR